MNGGALNYTGNEGNVTNVNNGIATKVSSLNLSAPSQYLGSFATTFQTPLTALSTQLNAVAANSIAWSSSGAISFNATPNSSGVAVFDVNTSLFSGASSVTFNLDGATSVIINVNVSNCVSNVCAFSPGSVNFLQGPVQGSTDYASMVLWNFVNATSLDFTTEFVGSVLAPDAAVTNSSPIDGTLVAASDTGSSTGELHNYSYTGTLPGIPAPEPASLALIGTGLAGLVLLSHTLRRASVTHPAPQHGHRGRCLTRATISRRLGVAIEFEIWRSGRRGGAFGSVTGGNVNRRGSAVFSGSWGKNRPLGEQESVGRDTQRDVVMEPTPSASFSFFFFFFFFFFKKKKK